MNSKSFDMYVHPQTSVPMASFEDLGDSVVPGTPKLATPHAVASPPQPAAMPDAAAFALEAAASSSSVGVGVGIPEAAAAALASQEGADRTAVDFAQFAPEEPEMAADTEEGMYRVAHLLAD